jgi:hypothetical protein
LRPVIVAQSPAVLKVGHHGSACSSDRRFVEAVHPRLALIIVGRHNLFGHPAAATLADCPGATHLRLRPKAGADPFYYNLRELWVTTASGRICKAVALWNGLVYMRHRYALEVTLDVNAEGYTNVTAESSEPTGTFDH